MERHKLQKTKELADCPIVHTVCSNLTKMIILYYLLQQWENTIACLSSVDLQEKYYSRIFMDATKLAFFKK